MKIPVEKQPPYSTNEGFAILGPELVRVRELLEAQFLEWARQVGADNMAFPPLLPVDALAAFDYFENFPHLMLLAAPIDPAQRANTEVRDGSVANTVLTSSRYALASAACYNVYLYLQGTRLRSTRYVTTVATCFRNEAQYRGLRRLRGFTMREIVCVGDPDRARDHIVAFKPMVTEFAGRLDLKLDVRVAKDPFFRPEGPRAVFQELFPVKEEFVHGGSLAVASVNFHRNFFGERCDIRLPDGTPAFSSCVAFGLERWLAALLEAHGNVEVVLDLLEKTKA